MAQKMFLITENEMEEYKHLKEWEEYQKLKAKNTKMGKYVGYDHCVHCPVCGYVVDYKVPAQAYCDRCGQRLED